MGPLPLPLRRVHTVWTSTPWLHWAAVLALPMLFNLVDRLVALHAVLDMYAAPNERDAGRKLGGILLGLMQDFLVATLLLVFLLFLEFVRSLLSTPVRAKIASPRAQRALQLLGHALRFALVLVGIVALLAFFAADQLLVRSREMRFTTDLIVTYFREKDQASALDVDPREVRLAIQTVVGTTCMALFFAVFYVGCVDMLWLKPLEPASGYAFKPLETSIPAGEAKKMTLNAQQLEEGRTASQSPTSQDDSSGSRTDIDDSYAANAGVDLNSDNSATSDKPSKLQQIFRSKKLRLALAAVIAYVVLLVVTRAIANAASPVVAAIALNATLNELFRNVFHVQFQQGSGSGSIESAAYFLNAATEKYELFQNDVLFRKTTGFQGPLAFDVQVEDKEKNPPNVLVVAVESFRYMDSLLLAGQTAAAERLAKHNLTLTPNFDRWAKRGIAFNNMWSSWQTSRSLEAILFGQVAYDSVTDSGTTRGRKDTKLVGMPQLFKQKGYETMFSTGCIVTYDQWDAFLPSHGFDSVMAAPQMKLYAEKNYNMSKGEWDGPAHRGLNWGVHDDISFQIIGDLMINKTKAQAERVKRGEKKQPFFMNHYTISSHGPFEMHPAWYDAEKLPDFSPLCEGWGEQCNLIKNYAKMRYFTDMELGKFLDRMKAQGVLEDTIVVIVGDHGQSPETAVTVAYQTAVTHVASTLIAEGRLGKHAGMIFEDATHHYDLLNTLADIVGVPEEGFLQTGVGRSLKRKLPFGERLVWSNNPMKKMSVVRGHERFVYDRTTSGMGLFDTIKDPLEENDLLPTLSASDANKLREFRRMGRDLNSYFKHRWEHKCLAEVSC